MSKEKKGRRWEIFKKNQEDKKSNDSAPKKPSVSTNLQLNAEIVNGTCPHCNLATVLVNLWFGNIYRCMTCGYDVEQKVNGKISYIPYVVDKNKFEYKMKIDTNG